MLKLKVNLYGEAESHGYSFHGLSACGCGACRQPCNNRRLTRGSCLDIQPLLHIEQMEKGWEKKEERKPPLLGTVAQSERCPSRPVFLTGIVSHSIVMNTKLSLSSRA